MSEQIEEVEILRDNNKQKNKKNNCQNNNY